ncbi:hypothetical protein D3C77_517600 [compost metagenome]
MSVSSPRLAQVMVGNGSRASFTRSLPWCVAGAMIGLAMANDPPRGQEVTVRSGSCADCTLSPDQFAIGTMNGSAASITNFFMPLAIRRSVAGARSFLRPKMLWLGMVQSMHSAAVRHFCWPLAGFFAWVGSGHTMGWPSHRAIMNRRSRLVGAPKSQALITRHSTT